MHGGDLYLKNFAVCIIAILSSTAFSAKKSALNPDLQTIFSDLRINITKTEKNIASDFNRQFKNSKNFLFSHSKMRNLQRKLAKNQTFSEYRTWPSFMLDISKANTLTSIKKACSNIDLNGENTIQNILTNNAKYFCLNKYLSILQRVKYRKFIKNQGVYLAQHESYIFHPKLTKNLSKTFSLYARDTKPNIALSNAAITYYTKTDQIPKKNIRKKITYTPEFTRYLQTKDLAERSTKHVFYKELKKMMKETLAKLNNNTISDKELKVSTQSILNYFNLTLEYQPKEKAMLSLLAHGKSLARRSKHTQAQRLFKRILREKSFHYDKTIFEHMWSYISQGEYKNALAELETNYLKSIKDPTNNSKLYFWLGLMNLKAGNEARSSKIFKDLISKSPLSYYAILSSKVLSKDNDADTKNIYLSHIGTKKYRSIANKNININALKRLSLWNTVNNNTFFRSELKNIYKYEDPKLLENHILAIAYHLSKNGYYLDSFKVLYSSIEANKLSVNESTLKLLFPVPYYAQVKSKTKEFDPIIALSLIRQESAFNRFARSHVGARGLMQLMPGTAKRFKRRVKNKHLYNSNLNITIGTKYFHNLMNRYDNNLVYSLAAYNAGEGRVDRWQETYLNSESILKNIENIPYLETRKYVKLIFRNIFFYKMLLADNKSDSNDLNQIYDIHLGFDR